MKITITPEGNIEFDVDLSNGHVAEAAELVRNLQGNPSTPVAPVKASTPTRAPRLPKERLTPPESERHPRTSRYYSVNRKKHSKPMADTYDYIAGYKNGRTTQQVAEHLGLNMSSTWTRLGSLRDDGLILSPPYRGGFWVATNNPLQVDDSKEEHRPTPAEMPKHRGETIPKNGANE